MQTETFTKEAGIAVQKEQLLEWSLVLKPEHYKKLKEFATKDNHKAKSGLDIKRGVDLDNFMANYAVQLRRALTTEAYC